MEDDNIPPVIVAAGNGHLEVVRFLLESGVGRHSENGIGRTVLQAPASNGHLEKDRLVESRCKSSCPFEFSLPNGSFRMQ